MAVAQWCGSMWLNQAAEVLEEHEEDGSVPWSGWAGYLGKQVVTHTHTHFGKKPRGSDKINNIKIYKLLLYLQSIFVACMFMHVCSCLMCSCFCSRGLAGAPRHQLPTLGDRSRRTGWAIQLSCYMHVHVPLDLT